MFLIHPQVFFSMLEIYNEQVTDGFSCALCKPCSFFVAVLLFSIFRKLSKFLMILLHVELWFLFRLLLVQVVDLLSRGTRPPGGLRVREEQQRGFYVEGLRTIPCESAPQVLLYGKNVKLSVIFKLDVF